MPKKKKKKDNKGFTLIEIIGVIVIIGIVGLIGALSINQYVQESKEKTYESFKKDLSGSTENFMIDCFNNGEEGCTIPEYGNDVKITYQELVDKGYSKRLKDPEGDGYCDTSYVIAKNTSEYGMELEYQVCLFCNKYKSTESGCVENSQIDGDSIPPTCDYTQLVGATTEWSRDNKVISIGCKDSGIGCRQTTFSRSIGTEGEDITKSSITIEDNAGNKTVCEVDAYVDKKAPTCELSVVDTNSSNWYQSGVEVVMTNTSDSGSGIASFGMGTSILKRDYNGQTTYKVEGGITTVFGYVRDAVGNEGYCSKEIKIDDSRPTGTIYMGYEVYPKESSTITQNIITIADLNRYGKIYKVGIKLNSLPTSMYAVRIYNENDQLLGTGLTSISKDYLIIDVDGTIDTLKIDLGNGDIKNALAKIEVFKQENVTSVWTNKDVSVLVDAYDTISGLDQYSFNNGSSYQQEEFKSYSSNISAMVKIKDRSGNESDAISYTINKIDKLKPMCSLGVTSGTLGLNNWYISNSVVVEFTSATDTGGSGLGAQGISSNSADNYVDQTATIKNNTVDTTLTGYVRDNAGNEKTCNIIVKKDSTKPSCSLQVTSGTKGLNNWYISERVIVGFANVTDDGGSELNAQGMSSDKTINYVNQTVTINSDTVGTTLTGYVRDNAGNENKCSLTVKKDAMQPYMLTSNLDPILNNIVLTQWDQPEATGNVVEEAYIKDDSRSCYVSDGIPTCEVTLCLREIAGSFNISGYHTYLNNYFRDATSGFATANQRYEMLDKNGNPISNGACLKVNSPCVWNWTFSAVDNAGNIRNNAFQIIYKVGYIGNNQYGC